MPWDLCAAQVKPLGESVLELPWLVAVLETFSIHFYQGKAELHVYHEDHGAIPSASVPTHVSWQTPDVVLCTGQDGDNQVTSWRGSDLLELLASAWVRTGPLRWFAVPE